MRVVFLLFIALLLTGCATTFVPISWGMREEVLRISRQDEVLNILFNKYDPERKTLRVDGPSFNIVEKPHETWKYEGAYRPDHKLIYRNSEVILAQENLRNVILHEMAHHIWFTYLSTDEKKMWLRYLKENPSDWQTMVRVLYKDSIQYDAEDFAYTIEFAREHDIQELVSLSVISEEEMRTWLQVNKQLGISSKGFQPKLAVK